MAFSRPSVQRVPHLPGLPTIAITEYSRKFTRRFNAITGETREFLLAKQWPGNARELRYMIERIYIMHDAETLQVEHLPKELATDPGDGSPGTRHLDFPVPAEHAHQKVG